MQFLHILLRNDFPHTDLRRHPNSRTEIFQTLAREMDRKEFQDHAL